MLFSNKITFSKHQDTVYFTLFLSVPHLLNLIPEANFRMFSFSGHCSRSLALVMCAICSPQRVK